MSGYQTHELCLTPFEEPASVIRARARAFLERGYALIEDANWGALLEIEGQGPGEYAVSESFDPTDEELDEAIAMGYGVQILQKVKLLRAHYTTMLMIVPASEERVGFIWKIESATFYELHGWEGPKAWNHKMKTAVAGYVFGLARACAAEGFVLKYDRDELRAYSREELRHAMLHYESGTSLAAPALAGLEAKYVPLQLLLDHMCRGRPSKHYYVVSDRYTVEDYMFPSDKPW